MRKQLIMIVALVMAISVAMAEEAKKQEIPWADIKDACNAFLERCSSKEETKAILSRLYVNAKTKMDDQGIDEDRALREIMLDWAAGNSAAASNKERKAMVHASVYFILFVDKGYDVPWQIRDRLTPENVDGLIKFLKTGTPK